MSERFTRLTTVVTLHGPGHRGIGEDTTHAPPNQLAFRSADAVLPLAGDWSVDTFSATLEQMELFLPLPDDSGLCRLVRVQRTVAARLGAARSTSSGSARCRA